MSLQSAPEPEAPVAPVAPVAEVDGGDWVAYTDDEGDTYYHCEATDVTAWELPPGARIVGNRFLKETYGPRAVSSGPE